MSTRQVTAHIPIDEYTQLAAEAESLGTTPTAFAQAIIMGRNQKAIEVTNSDVDRLRAKYEGIIEVLNQQLEKAQQQLIQTSEKAGLNGVETEKGSVRSLVAKAVEEERQRFKMERLETENTTLKEENEELEKEVEQLRDQVNTDARMAKYMETGGKVLEGIARMNPAAGERIASGIAGLFGAPAGLPGGDNLTDDQQRAFEAGQAIMHDFPSPDHQAAVIDILRFFSKVPVQIGLFMTKYKPFVTWQSQA